MTEDPKAAPVADPIRVVIADDHVLYRRGLQMVVSQDEDFEIVGEAGDGKEAVDRTVELLPDVVLMDVRMPHTSGIEACQRIKSQVPSTKIIMLTMSDEESDLYEAVKAGANGYLLKDVPGEEIADEPVRTFETGIVITVRNDKGVLARVAASLSAAEADITHVEMSEEVPQDSTDLRFVIAVRDRTHLDAVLRAVRRTPSVLSAVRTVPAP